MKTNILVAVVPAVLAIASITNSASAQTVEAPAAPVAPAAAPAATTVTTTVATATAVAAPATTAAANDGRRFRFGADVGYGVMIGYQFSNYRFFTGTVKTINLRAGMQLNHNWSLLGRLGVQPLGDANLAMVGGLVEFSNSDYFGIAFGPMFQALVADGTEPSVAPGATLRATGYVGSVDTNRRHSFAFGVEANSAFFPGAVMNSVSVTLGYEMR